MHPLRQAGLKGTGTRMPVPVPIHVPSNRKVPVPYRSYLGSWSDSIDKLGQGVSSMVARVGWHVTQPDNACNDGSTVSGCTYPYVGGVNVAYKSSVCFCNEVHVSGAGVRMG
jgi:hypothetical protein